MSVATLVMFNDSLDFHKRKCKVYKSTSFNVKKNNGGTRGRRKPQLSSCRPMEKDYTKKEIKKTAITITMSSRDTSHASIMHLHKHVKIFCLHMLKCN